MMSIRPVLVHAVGRAGLAAFAFTTLAGCYNYVPVAGTAPTGQSVQLEITDQGRVDLHGSIGEQPLRVEGRLQSLTDSSYTVAVQSVESLRGDATTWTGEPVTFRRADVSIVRVKRLDRTRSGLAALIAAGAVGAFVATRSLVSNGGSRDDSGVKGPGGTPGSS